MNHPIEDLLAAATSDDEVARIIYREIAKRSHYDSRPVSPSDHAVKSDDMGYKSKSPEPSEQTQAATISPTTELVSDMDVDPRLTTAASRSHGCSLPSNSSPTQQQLLNVGMNSFVRVVSRTNEDTNYGERQTLGIAPMSVFSQCDDDTEMMVIQNISVLASCGYDGDGNEEKMSDVSNVSDKTEWYGGEVVQMLESVDFPSDEDDEAPVMVAPSRNRLSDPTRDYDSYVMELEEWETSRLICQCHKENVRSFGLTRPLVRALLLEAAHEGWAERYLNVLYPWFSLQFCHEFGIDTSGIHEEIHHDERVALIVEALRDRLEVGEGYESNASSNRPTTGDV